MESRRDFIKKAALLSGATLLWSMPESIQRALAIDPETGSTYLDAEHIVILMQENRSFDHCFGTLQGVRGYNDPRAHILPNLNPVWLQTNHDGDTFAPFRLDIKETNATWMGSLPHSWSNQVDARNGGNYDKWLIVKPTGYHGYEKMPMTLGHYTRQDIPFYYAFADAFTICDQHFCSALTGTTPNRLYLWTGMIRPEQSAESKPHVYNEETDYPTEASWTTFPERLEDAGISWKIYQNEISLESGLEGDHDSWLTNFTDNPIEFFSQYNVRFSPRHREYLATRCDALQAEITQLQKKSKLENVLEEQAEAKANNIASLRKELSEAQEALSRWSQENFDKLSTREKNLHKKAFTVNENDPHYRELETITYQDGVTERTVKAPKGDILYQFREDVRTGNLPTVSWLVGPENFSDHPSSAWYGAWYVSEALDILTKNAEVWKKTIFILTYDENDGYFDHVPPFVAPNPQDPKTGRVSAGIDAGVEYVTLDQDHQFRPTYPPRESSIGLGYRVPLIVASPWSRGGCVCSQVFDHTSVIQFMEHFLTQKTGKNILETNITAWRRTVCGDLTSMFQPFSGSTETPIVPKRDEFIEDIHRARFKKPPTSFKALSTDEIDQIKRNSANSLHMPSQELGTRKSCPLPYELYVDGGLSQDRSKFEIRFKAGDSVFGSNSSGSPFNVYAYHMPMQTRAYAVAAGKSLTDSWESSEFNSSNYHLRVDGPNGFMREFKGNLSDPELEIRCEYVKGAVAVVLKNSSNASQVVIITDASYGANPVKSKIGSGHEARLAVQTENGKGWYDFVVKVEGRSFERRYAGRVETGRWGVTDPAMGRT